MTGMLIAGCSTSAQSVSSSAATSASPSADALQEWCNSYSSISSVLAESGTTSSGAGKALLALDRFAKLWQLAGEAEILSPDETNANLRAVIVYRDVIQLLADGADENGPEVTAAKEKVTAATQQDHDLLQSSAGKILGICGTATPAPSAG
jgi:hypothetical protein